MWPLAPGLFSTITGCPHIALRRGASVRAGGREGHDDGHGLGGEGLRGGVARGQAQQAAREGGNKDSSRGSHVAHAFFGSGSMMVVRSVAMPSMLHSTTSPGFKNSSAAFALPTATPPGAPVENMSPGSLGMWREKCSRMSGSFQIWSRVFTRMRCSPFTAHVIH